MNRRGFLQRAAMGAAALLIDPERLLWTPGAKKIFIPPVKSMPLVLSAPEWVYVQAAWDRQNGEVIKRLYVDGMLWTEQEQPATALEPNCTSFRVGHWVKYPTEISELFGERSLSESRREYCGGYIDDFPRLAHVQGYSADDWQNHDLLGR